MSEPADSTGEPGEATGAGVVQSDNPADSTPNSEATGQEQGDQSAEKRVNDLMALANKRLSERDQAQAEVEALRARLAEIETEARAEEPQPSQIELMYPDRFAAEPEADTVDPYAQPEPVPVVMPVWPSRGQSVPLGAAPVIGDASSPSVRYQQDQADIAAMKSRLNVLGADWVAEAKANGLMQD